MPLATMLVDNTGERVRDVVRLLWWEKICSEILIELNFKEAADS